MAWFICPYKRDTPLPGLPHVPRRYCAMRDFNDLITSDGGDWRETEILGDRAIVKVRASPSTLSTINAAPGFVRIPLDAMDNPLSSLSSAQRTAIRNQVLDAGYTNAEVTARFPNLATNTVGDVLRFLATRRKKPRYDAATDTIVLDGADQPCVPIDAIDQRVS